MSLALSASAFELGSCLKASHDHQIISNNIHPRVIFCSDGRGAADALGGGGWSDKADVGDFKVSRLLCTTHMCSASS